MTAPVIELDLDQPEVVEAPAEPTVLPFHIWAQAWGRRHPWWAGSAVGVVIAVVAAIVVLTALVIRWWPPDPPPAAPFTRVFAVQTTGAEEVTTAIRRGGEGSVGRGEVLGSEPFTLEGVTSMSVTVRGSGASCRILVDGQLVDEAQVGELATSVTCLWTAPKP